MSRRARFAAFLAVLLTVLGGADLYLGLRSMAMVPWLAARPGLVWGILAGFPLLVGLVPILHRALPTRTACRLDPLYWLAYGAFGLFSTFLVYLPAADLAQAATRGVGLGGPGLTATAWSVAAGAALLSVLAGLANVLREVPVERREVPFDELDPRLEGFHIVQISDLHIGPFSRGSRLRALAAQVNELAPDLVAVTGDLVDGEADGARDKVELLAPIRARHGVFFVTGNHEYYSGVGPWLRFLAGMGWRVLQNEHQVLDHGGAALTVLGLPDPTDAFARRGVVGPSLAQALEQAPTDGFRLLLFHPPSRVEEAARASVHLQLSGHTHAGQYFPWSLLVRRLWRHAQGLHRVGGMWIHTSRGTGFWGPPNRFLVPPELTLLMLKRTGAERPPQPE